MRERVFICSKLPLQFLSSSLWVFQTLRVFQCAFSCFQLAFPLPSYFCLVPSWTSCFCATISLPTMPVFSGENANLSLPFFSPPASCPKLTGKDQSRHKQQWCFSLTHKTLTPEIHLLKALGHDNIPFPFQFLGFHLHGLRVRPSRAEEGTTEG